MGRLAGPPPVSGVTGCGFTWPSGIAQPHECMQSRGHTGAFHRCRCGATRRRH